MFELVDGIASAAALASVTSVLAGLRAARAKRAAPPLAPIEIREDDGTVLYRDPGTDTSGQSTPASTAATPTVVEVDEADALTAEDVVTISRASTTHLPDPKKPWYKDAAVLTLAGVFFSSLLSAGTAIYVARSGDAQPDCSAYASALLDVHSASPNADVEVLFGEGGMNFGDAEAECGPPEQFFEGLG